MDKASIAQPIQPAAKRADPQRAVGVLAQRTDLVVRETVGGCKQFGLSMLPAPQALSIGAGPQNVVFARTEHDYRAVQEWPARDRILKPAAAQFVEAARRGDPEPAGTVFQRVEHQSAR